METRQPVAADVCAGRAVLDARPVGHLDPGAADPVQRIPAAPESRTAGIDRDRQPVHRGQAQDTDARRPHPHRHHARGLRPRPRVGGLRRTLRGRRREHAAARPAVVGGPGAAVAGRVELHGQAHGRPGRPGRAAVGGQEPRQTAFGNRRESELRRRGRCRRGQGRAARVGGLPEEPQGLRPAGRAHAQGHPAGGPARHRQDAAGARDGRRGRGAVLQHHRLRVCRDVRRRRRGAGA